MNGFGIIGFQDPALLGIELVYSLLVIILCLFIYYKTKEIYDLTKHEGIGFFRNAFAFFALAYFFRLVFAIFPLIHFTFDVRMPFRPHIVGLYLTVYAGSMAILCLVFSSFSHKLKVSRLNLYYLMNLIALVMAVITFFFHNPLFVSMLQMGLFLAAIVLAFGYSRKKKGKFSRIYKIYSLLFIFWVLNLFTFVFKRHIHEIRVPLYLLSLAMFIFITYRVVRKIK